MERNGGSGAAASTVGASEDLAALGPRDRSRRCRSDSRLVGDASDADKRAVFVLYELEELAMAEVAEAIGCPLQTAYSRLHAARADFEAAVNRRRAKERVDD